MLQITSSLSDEKVVLTSWQAGSRRMEAWWTPWTHGMPSRHASRWEPWVERRPGSSYPRRWRSRTPEMRSPTGRRTEVSRAHRPWRKMATDHRLSCGSPHWRFYGWGRTCRTAPQSVMSGGCWRAPSVWLPAISCRWDWSRTGRRHEWGWQVPRSW